MNKKTKFIKEHFTTPKGKAIPASKGGPLGMGKLGFIAPELAQFVYGFFTVLLILFAWTSYSNPGMLLMQRVAFLAGTVALWFLYKLWPCKFMMLLRVGYMLTLLGSWYPDTYELNKTMGCLDHIFASYEQDLFGCQPALVFSQAFPSAVVSELMYMGYFCYYLFFVVTAIIVYFRDYKQLERVAYIILAGFFCCYVIYDLLPVVGPQYYYHAVGVENIANAKFPNIGRYFENTTDCLTMPGWSDGIFYNLVGFMHHAGERPTAAFPSSHVGIAMLVMLMVAKMRMWKWFGVLAIPFVFLCMATVYIQAHYAIDALAGLLLGVILFLILGGLKLKAVR